jgi:hypothetical protein
VLSRFAGYPSCNSSLKIYARNLAYRTCTPASLRKSSHTGNISIMPQTRRSCLLFHNLRILLSTTRNLLHRPLYKIIAPISKACDVAQNRSIVFIGHIGVGNDFPAVECQAMWATAYMDGKLAVPTWEEQEQEIPLSTARNRRRYLSSGMEGNNMTFKLIGYTDSLLGNLGLSSHRKGFLKDLFVPCKASNFASLKGEYIRKYGRDT